MKKILVINASARAQGSISRNLSEAFLNYWKGIDPVYQLTFRDLASTNIPHINENWIDADAKPEKERNQEDRETLKPSDTYIQELRDADLIILATPMYNWSIPSTLKAYIDQIMRVNETFMKNPDTSNPENGKKHYIGLLENKPLILLFSRGSLGYEKGERNEHMNFQSAYLRMVFGIIGIDAVYELAINGTSRKDEQLNEEMLKLHDQIQKLIHQEFIHHEE